MPKAPEPTERKKVFAFSLPPSLVKRVVNVCKHLSTDDGLDRPTSWAVRAALESWLRENDRSGKKRKSK